MKRLTAEQKLRKCVFRYFNNPNSAELRSLRIELYRIDSYQLSEKDKLLRLDLLKNISKLLGGK